jgi:hypothetical protein
LAGLEPEVAIPAAETVMDDVPGGVAGVEWEWVTGLAAGSRFRRN